MFFSIVIPTCNRTDLLGKCLSKLDYAEQCLDAADYEVIVTDDGTSDSTKSFIEKNYSWVKWIRGPQRGPAANRNNGVNHAQGSWLVFIDDDCEPQPFLLRNYQQAIFQNGTCLVFEGKTITSRPFYTPLETAPVNMKGGHLWSCNFCINTDFFKQIGQFDEFFRMPHLEDNDLAHRIRKICSWIFVDNAIVMHPPRRMPAGKVLAWHHYYDIYYFNKINRRFSLFSITIMVIKTRLVVIRDRPKSIDSVRALFSLLNEVFIIISNYRSWKRQIFEQK